MEGKAKSFSIEFRSYPAIENVSPLEKQLHYNVSLKDNESIFSVYAFDLFKNTTITSWQLHSSTTKETLGPFSIEHADNYIELDWPAMKIELYRKMIADGRRELFIIPPEYNHDEFLRQKEQPYGKYLMEFSPPWFFKHNPLETYTRNTLQVLKGNIEITINGRFQKDKLPVIWCKIITH